MLHTRGLCILSLMEAQMLPLPGNPKASYISGTGTTKMGPTGEKAHISVMQEKKYKKPSHI